MSLGVRDFFFFSGNVNGAPALELLELYCFGV